MELKHEIPAGHEVFLLKKIMKSTLSFREAYPYRMINSIYFDTFSLSGFEESVSGNQIRQKHRMRWYETASEISPVTYEIKHKNSHLSWKHLNKTKHLINYNAQTWDELLIKKISIHELPFPSLTNLKPVSLVTYKRLYYVSWDERIRLTIDNHISFRNQRLLNRPNFKDFSYHTSSSIVEMKFAEEDFDLAKNLQQAVDIKPQRFSKYCESVSASNFSKRKS
jgi:hypothetical protein